MTEWYSALLLIGSNAVKFFNAILRTKFQPLPDFHNHFVVLVDHLGTLLAENYILGVTHVPKVLNRVWAVNLVVRFNSVVFDCKCI